MCRPIEAVFQMPIVSKVARANSKSLSVKTTVPGAIVAFLEIKHKDGLEWTMKTSGNERFVVVRKALSD